RGGSLGGRDRRPGRGHVDGLGFALGGDRAVVVVTGVGGDPRVGADTAELQSQGSFVCGVARDFGFVFGQRRALAFAVVVELPGDRAAGGFEQARDVGLSLHDALPISRGGSLGGRDRRPGRGHVDGLGFALGGDRAVVVVTGVGGDP